MPQSDQRAWTRCPSRPRSAHARLLRRVVLLLALPLFATGCGTAPRPAPAAAVRGATTLDLQVVNRSWSDVTVYMVRPSGRIRLGKVTALSVRRFRLNPRHHLPFGSLQLLSVPFASGEPYVATPIDVRAGDQVELVLEHGQAFSHIFLRPR